MRERKWKAGNIGSCIWHYCGAMWYACNGGRYRNAEAEDIGEKESSSNVSEYMRVLFVRSSVVVEPALAPATAIGVRYF